MIKQFLLNLFISSFCLSIDIKLEINENYLQNRSFNFQLNFNQQIFKCFILYKFNNNIEEENIKIEGIELEKNKKYSFKNVDRNFHIFNKKGEIIGKNEEYLNAEFCIEILNNPLLEIIPSAKNQVNTIFILT